MLKFKKLKLILCTVLVTGSLIGCNKQTAVSKDEIKNDSTQEQNIKEEENSLNETQNENEDEDRNNFDIYKNMLDCQYRSSDISSAFRNPSTYAGQKFTFSGTVLKSNTSENGIQMVTVEVDSLDMFEYGSMYGEGTVVKLKYDIEAFGEERLVEKDRLAVCAEFIDIKNDSEYGDIAEFKILAKANVTDYLSILALRDYFNSIGVDIKSVGLELVQFSTDEELVELIGEFSASYIYDYEKIALYSTNSNVYWMAERIDGDDLDVEGYDMDGYYIGMPAIKLYSGEKNDDGEIYFNFKEYVCINELNF